MKTIFALCLLLTVAGNAESHFTETSHVQMMLPGWMTDELSALQRAQQEKKPLVVAFLGDGWCPWSEKWAQEMLGKTEFVELLDGHAVLLHVAMAQDNPGRMSEIREKYQVYHCPQMIAYAKDGEEIGRIEYAPMDPKQYATQIFQLIGQFNEIRSYIDHPEETNDIEQLQRLYQNAQKLSSSFYKDKLLQLGLERDSGTFFLLEKYGTLIRQLKLKNPLVQQMRKKVLERDPKNAHGTHLSLAILEFEKLSRALKSKESPDKAAIPLVSYLQKYGKKDKENLWKVELMLAHFYFSKNRIDTALSHAKVSHERAPDAAKGEIADLIEYFSQKTQH
ncbi:MAG: thioredoxin family protein [Rhabdochlamydiaceae bacterium]|nr:thioredoxin family protein [Rhabdochlamydiaceae bacterium]